MLIKAITLKADSIDITGQLYQPSDRNSYPTVCVCHGIPSGNPPDPNDRGYPELAERICHEGFNVFIFNFRGTGASSGNFDILGWTRDLKVVIDYLWTLSEVDRSHLSLLGFSGGAAVSVYVASQDDRISRVTACACPAEFTLFIKGSEPQSLVDHFHSIGAIRDENFPPSIEDWSNGFSLISPIKHIADIAPRLLLLVHGNQDDVVEVNDAYRLYTQAGEPKEIIIVDGAGHRLRRNDKAMTAVTNWLKSQC
jgi:alpha/beta superfamily hydrolase